jgi:hypothetical protein
MDDLAGAKVRTKGVTILVIDINNVDSSLKWQDRQKRIELINWVLENMKNPTIYICALIESKMNEIMRELFLGQGDFLKLQGSQKT